MINMIRNIFVVAALLAVPSFLYANEPQSLPDYNGDQLFQRFCTSCHGKLGHGDGPVASSLKVPVPDLTLLSQRADGSFPAQRVREIIDGRAVLPAHGTRPMPVWGYELEAQVSGRDVAQSMIDQLVDYLKSIQR